jgi:hypothetical protein
MSTPPYLQEVFEHLRSGHHLTPEDEPSFSAVLANSDAYATYFAPLGLTLVRHPSAADQSATRALALSSPETVSI